MTRLTLDMTGITSPLDVGDQRTPAPAPAALTEPAPEPRQPKRSPRARRPPATSRKPAPQRAEHDPVPPFYAAGRPIQTSIALDAHLAGQLEDLARAAAVSVNALLVATLQAGLPTSADVARHVAIMERADRSTVPRVETNIRLPEQLRARLDQLTAAVRDAAKRATRADLANAILRAALPPDAERAAELVREHQRRLELLALAA